MLAILVQSLGACIIAFLPNPEISGHSFSNMLDFKMLPPSLFEVKSNLRRYAIPLVLVYVLGLVLLMLPYIILFLILHLQYWYIMLAVLFLGSTLILFNIFYKYAHYSPHRRRVYNSMGCSL